jgi:hypothetical protein
MADGFLGRWSRRKIEAKEGKPLEADPPHEPGAPQPGGEHAALPAGHPQECGDPATEPPAPPAALPPTLQDVEALTSESDFSRFVRHDVDPEVKNAAVRKLFADPHFNVMDGLDIYIDDYSKPDPLPPEMLRGLASAEFLGFFREAKHTPEPFSAAPEGTRVDADDRGSDFVAQSQPPEHDAPGPAAPAAPEAAPESPSPHANPDLRLQQNHALGPPGPGPGDQ